MYAERQAVTATTDADGNATAYTEAVTGAIHTAIYTKTDYAAGVDFTITGEVTGQTVWTESNVNASKTVCPRQATHDTAGVASLYAAAGEPVEAPVVLVNERIKIAIAQGGDTKSGAFQFIIA